MAEPRPITYCAECGVKAKDGNVLYRGGLKCERDVPWYCADHVPAEWAPVAQIVDLMKALKDTKK
jgi:hypothetical protein